MTGYRQSGYAGFALPTVMIASVVMLIVLLSGLVSASSMNTAIRDQYIENTLKQAAEAGTVMAEACLKDNNYAASWSTNALGPNTDCTGAQLAGFTCPAPSQTVALPTESRCAIVETNNLRTTFSVSAPVVSGNKQVYTVTATAYLMRSATRMYSTTRTVQVKQSVVYKNDIAASRPAKRFWLFGLNAGLDFGAEGTTVVPVNRCASGQTCNGVEGYTVIANKLGELQFFTDGRTVWNRDGNIMNGGLDSAGAPSNLTATASTTQAAAVFPIGYDERRYVIVTNNTESSVNDQGELFYSVVDMGLDSGRGAVLSTNKNRPLINGQTDYASEAMTAAPKADGTGYWVITYTNNTTRLVAVPFNNNGSAGSPVYTAAPFTPGKYNSNGGFGTLNFSSDYTKLVMMAGNHCTGGGTCASRSGLVRTMSFNSITGAATNEFAWNNSTTSNPAGYSADFSPDGTNVYTSTLYPGRIYRYRIAGAASSAAVAATVGMGFDTAATTSGLPGQGGGQVVRAPDGKMYVANRGANAISVINTPDAVAVGSVGWVYNGQTLCVGGVQPCNSTNNLSQYGLPQTVTIYSPETVRY